MKTPEFLLVFVTVAFVVDVLIVHFTSTAVRVPNGQTQTVLSLTSLVRVSYSAVATSLLSAGSCSWDLCAHCSARFDFSSITSSN